MSEARDEMEEMEERVANVLLGLAKENEGVAARILQDHDVSYENVRDAIVRQLSGPRERYGSNRDLDAALKEIDGRPADGSIHNRDLDAALKEIDRLRGVNEALHALLSAQSRLTQASTEAALLVLDGERE